jgi:hypothetical protein
VKRGGSLSRSAPLERRTELRSDPEKIRAFDQRGRTSRLRVTRSRPPVVSIAPLPELLPPFCFLARFGVMVDGSRVPPCDGRLIRVHLIPKQKIKTTMQWLAGEVNANDPRSWAWGCGGIVGNSGHHGCLDSSRTLRIPRAAIPAGTEELAELLGLGYWLDREYGERTV